MMMKVNMPTEAGNALVRSGKLGSTLEKILGNMKPEAAYFAEDNSSQLPAIAEPWFLAVNATLTVRPAMTIQDLEKAGPSIEKAAKEFIR
jgi:hypothetical protein